MVNKIESLKIKPNWNGSTIVSIKNKRPIRSELGKIDPDRNTPDRKKIHDFVIT
jgi:hypothetical protein